MHDDEPPPLPPVAARGATPPPAPGPPRGLGPPWLSATVALPLAFLLQLIVGTLVFLPMVLLEWSMPEELEGGPLLLSVALYFGVIPGLWLGWKLLDRASLADMGHEGPLGRSLRELAAGFLIGVAVLAAVVGLGAGLGAWTLSAGGWREVLGLQAVWIPALLVAAYFEELLLRGWILQDFGRRRPWLGLLLSSVLFACVHGANPGLLSEGWQGALLALTNIFLAGLLLGGAFLLSGRLWLPTGLHLGWNWTVAVLFGLPVSGFDLPSFLEGRATPEAGLLSGGAFGPEASLPAFAVLLPVGLLAAGWALRRGGRVPVVARHEPAAAAGDMITETSTAIDDGAEPLA